MAGFEALKLSVPDAVRTIITRNHHLYACLKMKVLNYTAVAQNIQKEVETMVGEPVKLNTIVASITRFSDTLEKDVIAQPLDVLKNARLNLITGVSDITVACSQDQQPKLIKKILELASKTPSVSIHQLPSHIKVIGDTNYLGMMINELNGEGDAQRRDGYASLHVKISPEAEHRMGVAAFIAERLYRIGINVVEGFFSPEDIVLILRESDASRAFEMLRNEINNVSEE